MKTKWKLWRRGWESEHIPTLNLRKLFILHFYKSDKSGRNAQLRYTAGTQEPLPLPCLHVSRCVRRINKLFTFESFPPTSGAIA